MEYDRKADNNINIEIIFPLAHTLGQKYTIVLVIPYWMIHKLVFLNNVIVYFIYLIVIAFRGIK